MKTRIFILAFLVIGFTSCMKEDSPITLPAKGDATYETLTMGADYSTQFYYNLRNKQVVHSSKVDSWDLAFESGEKSEAVYLNCGAGMALVKSNKTDFVKVSRKDCEGILWLQDDPSGLQKESAIGMWNLNEESRDEVFIVRLDAGNKEFRLIKIKEVTPNAYIIEVGSFESNESKQYKIEKDPTRVYSYFDLKTGSTVTEVEPIKESWDILFTRYGFTFYDQTPALPYIVTGVLTNPKSTVFKDSSLDFNTIDATIIPDCYFTTDRDGIGYDWKYYDFDLGQYHVRNEYNFIVKTQNEEYYKMRFQSFYDNNGLKGTPSFEFKQIQ